MADSKLSALAALTAPNAHTTDLILVADMTAAASKKMLVTQVLNLAGIMGSAPNSPANIAADQNDYAPGAGIFQRWNATGATRNITGMVAGNDGELRYVYVLTGSQTIRFQHQNAGSSAANRLVCEGANDLEIGAGGLVVAQYSASDSRWLVTRVGVMTGILYSVVQIGNSSGAGTYLGNGRVSLGSTGVVGWGTTSQGAGGTLDTGLARNAAGVLEVTNGAAGQDGWLMRRSNCKETTTSPTNATTTFANLTDLTLTVVSGRKYTGVLRVRCSDSTAADGIKFDFNGGSAAMTTFNAGVVANVQAATAGTTISAALATVINFTAMNGTTDHWIDIAFSFVPSGNGTFIPRFAQNAHSTGTAAVGVGSHVHAEDMPN